MGVTISQKLGQNKVYVKDTLDQAEKYAEIIKKNVVDDLTIEVKRHSDYKLFIDVSGCETLSFDFKSVEAINKEHEKEGYCYEWAVLTNGGKRELDAGYEIRQFPENEKYYSADFTKTQFAGNVIAHKIVADIIKVVASRCFFVEVNDEGDYYHSGKLGDAVGAIKSNGAMIDGLVGKLTEAGYDQKDCII